MRAVSRSAWRRTTVVLLTGLGSFQTGLACGLPWGRIAYGGQHDGRLPEKFRRVSAVAAATYVIAAVFIASEAGTPAARRKTLSSVTCLMAAGAGLNLVSRSRHRDRPARHPCPRRRAWRPGAARLGIAVPVGALHRIPRLARDRRLPGDPECNGCAERWIKTLKEQCLWARTYRNVDDLRDAVAAFVALYNTQWLIERLGHRTPRDEQGLRNSLLRASFSFASGQGFKSSQLHWPVPDRTGKRA